MDGLDANRFVILRDGAAGTRRVLVRHLGVLTLASLLVGPELAGADRHGSRRRKNDHRKTKRPCEDAPTGNTPTLIARLTQRQLIPSGTERAPVRFDHVDGQLPGGRFDRPATFTAGREWGYFRVEIDVVWRGAMPSDVCTAAVVRNDGDWVLDAVTAWEADSVRTSLRGMVLMQRSDRLQVVCSHTSGVPVALVQARWTICEVG